jgi:hypothetical protein
MQLPTGADAPSAAAGGAGSAAAAASAAAVWEQVWLPAGKKAKSLKAKNTPLCRWEHAACVHEGEMHVFWGLTPDCGDVQAPNAHWVFDLRAC